MNDNFTSYWAIDAVNMSALKDIDIDAGGSPHLYRYRRQNPRPDSDTFRVGRLFHCATLEPFMVESGFAACRDENGKTIARNEKQKPYQDFLAANAGKDILTPSDYDGAISMAEAARANPKIAALIEGSSLIEHALTWTDPVTGLRCKCRLDLGQPGGAFGDLKGVKSIVPHLFFSQVASLRWHTAAAWYWDGCVANGLDPARWVWPVVEKGDDLDSGIFVATDALLEAGRRHYRELLTLLADCLHHDRWPGKLGDEEVPVDLQSWAPGMNETDSEIEF